MDKPIALFARAAIAINSGTPEDFQCAVHLLEQVITRNKELMALEQQGVPVEDTIALENAYNQRALALLSLKRYAEAEEHFLLAVEQKPGLWEAYINLATLYFETHRPSAAKEVLFVGRDRYTESTSGPVHLTFLIQLGYAEELLGDMASAAEHYAHGLQLVEECQRTGHPYDQNHAMKLQHNWEHVQSLLRLKE